MKGQILQISDLSVLNIKDEDACVFFFRDNRLKGMISSLLWKLTLHIFSTLKILILDKNTLSCFFFFTKITFFF